MKKIAFSLVIISFFVAMLFFPHETFDGAQNGLLLWFQTLLPTLLPFIILSNLLIHTNLISYISKFLKPFLQKLFGVSEQSCYAILIGFICGYPIGAKVISDLLQTNRITRQEGQYLLSFCNNTSLMFIISYLVMQNFGDESLMLGTLFILLFSPMVCSFIFRKWYKIKFQSSKISFATNHVLSVRFEILDTSIMNGFDTITKIGGYIILFSILFSLCSLFHFDWIIPILEISNGIPWLLSANLSFEIIYPLVLALTSFGGLCAVAQTYSMIQGTSLSIFAYIIQKLITALVTSLFAFAYITFIHQ